MKENSGSSPGGRTTPGSRRTARRTTDDRQRATETRPGYAHADREAPPADAFEALADPTRRAILDLLRRHETRTAGEIASAFPAISRPAVSRHLRILREAGLVRAVQDGREWHYRIDPGALREVYAGWLARFAPLWERSLEQLKRRVEEAGE